MRLADWEVREIKEAARLVFGEDVKVILFGSRVYDDKKGGDIDLYVITDEPSRDKEGKFWIELQKRLGSRKSILF